MWPSSRTKLLLRRAKEINLKNVNTIETSEDSDYPDDSDADPLWSPSEDDAVLRCPDDRSPNSSPLTVEQASIAKASEEMLLAQKPNFFEDSEFGHSDVDHPAEEWQKPHSETVLAESISKFKEEKVSRNLSVEKQKQPLLRKDSRSLEEKIMKWKSERKEALKAGKKSRVKRITKNIKRNERLIGIVNNEQTQSPVRCLSPSAHTDRPSETNECPQSKQKTIEGKKYFCLFCKQLVGHFARHLINVHKDEEEVIPIASLEPKVKKRKELINMLRGRGTMIYNSDYQLNKGKLILTRNTKKEVNSKDFKPCPSCHNFYKKSSLWRHFRLCTGVASAPRDLQKVSEAVQLQVEGNKEISERLRNDVLAGMFNDKVRNYLLTDYTILDYGEYLCTKYKLDRHLTNMIRNKLRLLSKITLQMIQSNLSITNLEEALTPKYYDAFVLATNKVAGYDGSKFTSPSIVNEIGRVMKVVVNRRIIKCIKDSDMNRKTELENWLHIYQNDFYECIGKSALRSVQQKKWGKAELLPLVDDIMKLNEHIKNTIIQSESVLQDHFDKESFNVLNKSLMTEIQIFNRRRPLEVEMLKIQDFEKRHNVQKGTPAYDTLTPAEKIICSRYMRVEARGKLHLKPAPMLLSLKQVSVINLILSLRQEAGVSESNPYVFGCNNGFFKAYIALKQLAYASEAKNPDLLIGTLLRKQIATTVQALNFTDNEMTNLATFMSHDILTHRKFYRIPNEATHLAKISRLLIALNDGTISNFYGKSLDNIDVNVQVSHDNTTTNGCDEIEEDWNFTNSPNGLMQVTKTTEVPDVEDEESLAKRLIKQNDYHERRLKRKLSTPPKATSGKRISWSTPERHLSRKLFNKYINSQNNKLPTPLECREAIKNNKELQGRSINQLKGWVFSERKRIRAINKE